MIIGKANVGQTGCYTYLNEFGRDSLRVILKHLPDKRYLVPDLYCPIIIELMDTLKINYKFYHINELMQIDWDTVNDDDYDIFYYINFKIEEILCISNEKLLLEDNVFRKDFNICHPHYIGFNSWRKCTMLTSGSLIKSTIKLKESYWRLPTDQLVLLMQYREIYETSTYKHFVLSNRDEVQRKLAEHNIFLPVFWRGCKNILSEKILSIPLDDRYSMEDILNVEELICKYKS